MAEGGQDEGQEKSFEPTERRLEQAREKGDVAKSTDITAAAAYLALLVALLAAAPSMGKGFVAALAPFLGAADRLEGRILGAGGLTLSADLVWAAWAAVLPIFLAPFVLVLLALIAQRAVVVAPEKLKPKGGRINPVEIAKNKFGPTGLMEFAKNAVKMLLISTAAWLWIAAETPDLIGLARAHPRGLPRHLGDAAVSLLVVVLVIAIAIAAVDYLWQRYDHARKLRMTLEDIRKESKETDGDPYMRQSRRRRAEEIATNRMLLDVPQAQVVVVNPEHYAVALKWDRRPGAAPVVVAKGVDATAAAIRARAAEAGVPIHRDPPTARALHAAVPIGREIFEEHYRAVAAAIRYSEEVRRKARERAW